MTLEEKYSVLEEYGLAEKMELLINYAGYSDGVLDYVAEEYGIDWGDEE